MSMRIHVSLLLLAVLAAGVPSVLADVPAGYYASLNGKSGQALKDAVHELTKRRTVHSYGSLWYYFRETDPKENNADLVWDMYSDKTYRFTSDGYGATSGMNKEHSVPKSWWGGYNENQGYYAYTDLNHLYPSDADANMAKSNYPLGEVETVRFENGVTKVGTPLAGQGGGSSVVFEPDARYKGDFARTYFYMAACYQDYTWRYKYMYTEDTWLTLNQWSVELLLRWAREDPVSDKEKARNEAVYRCQNNRNPFIDNPNLIEYIWGDRQGDVFNDGGTDEPEGDPEITSPTQNMYYDLGEVALGRSRSITFPVKGKNLTSNVSVTTYRYDTDLFTPSVTSIDRSMANSADGYPLTVTYTPDSVGQHRTRLIFSDGGITGSFGIWLTAQCLEEPVLSRPVALDPEEVTDSSFVAAWEPATEEVDFYIVNRTVYDTQHLVVDSETFTTDDSQQTRMLFTDREHGRAYAYTVQSSRLGCVSEPSNTVMLAITGIDDVRADVPWAFVGGEGHVLIKCPTTLRDVKIHNMAGMLVWQAASLRNDTEVHLPRGVYVFTTSSSRQAAKLVIW